MSLQEIDFQTICKSRQSSAVLCLRGKNIKKTSYET